MKKLKQDKPLVSIVLPVHNSGSYLRDCLKSLTSQSYRNIEIVAIDDNSKDHSYKILRQFAKKDKRIKASRNVKRYGISVTLNRLINRARGTFIAFMDAADLSTKDRIKKQLDYLLSQPQVVAVGTQCMFIKEDSKKIGKSKFPKENQHIYDSPLHGVSMQFETVMINKSLLPKDILKFNLSSNPFIYSDIFIKLLRFGKFANLENYLHYHRNHPNTYYKDLRRNALSFIRLWLRSILFYNHDSSIRSFFSPLIKSV